MIKQFITGAFFAAAAFAAEGGDASHGSEHGEESLGGVIMHHISNAPLSGDTAHEWGISKAVAVMLAAALALIALMAFAARKSRLQGAPKGWTNAIEVVVVYIRDEVAIAGMGSKWGKRFTPFFCTLFFFILFSNLAGLVPGSYTPTSNLNVTFTLALITLALMILGGLIAQGPIAYIKHMAGPPGTPLAIVPLVFLIEFLSLFIKPIALTIRLGANMTAGHIVILVMLSFIFVFKSLLLAPVSVALAAAIMVLEIIVAFIQAYVFTLLSAIFIGMGLHEAHH
jgi:F-type H+-transporting ATPase subunit a